MKPTTGRLDRTPSFPPWQRLQTCRRLQCRRGPGSAGGGGSSEKGTLNTRQIQQARRISFGSWQAQKRVAQDRETNKLADVPFLEKRPRTSKDRPARIALAFRAFGELGVDLSDLRAAPGRGIGAGCGGGGAGPGRLMCRIRRLLLWGERKPRPPSSALLPTCLGEGSPKINYRKKGTLILTSLLRT